MNRPTFSFAGMLAATLACCTTDVPVGFDSGTSQASRDVVANPGSIVEAARAVLYELGDAVETVVDDERTTLRTGRARIVVADRGAGSSRLEVFVMRYVGPDHANQAAMLLDRIVRRIG